jgi:hypothetical protein
MKKKIGTVMEDKLLWEAKKVALEKRETLSQVFEEAMEAYLENIKKEKRKKGVARRTQGMFKLTSKEFKEVMDEPGVYDV